MKLKLIVDSPYNYWNPPLTTKLGPKMSSTIFLVCQIGSLKGTNNKDITHDCPEEYF